MLIPLTRNKPTLKNREEISASSRDQPSLGEETIALFLDH